MEFNFDNILQILLIVVCVYLGIKITTKFIKFLLFIAVIIAVIYLLLDMGLINVPY